MPDSLLNVNELRHQLRNPELLSGNGFLAMQSLTALQHGSDIEEQEFQDLVLYALEHRERFGAYSVVLNALVREIGLFPYLDPKELSFADRIAYEFHRPENMEDKNIVFHRPQARVYRELMNGRSVVLSAPTSFGKSLVIDAVIVSEKFTNILVIVPTIALIDETRRRISDLQSSYKVITHPSQARSPRNIYIFTQERALDLEDLEEVDFFVIDEFYKLAPNRDGESRASLLNQVFYELSRRRKQFYMLGPSIRNIPEDMGSRLECTFIYEPYNTVVSEVHRVTGEGDEFERLAQLCKSLEGPTIIFCTSPPRTANVASALIDYGVGETRPEVAHAVEWIGREYHPDWHFAKALSQGIGVHHGRIPRALAQYVVRAFDSGFIKYLICTSTLIEGVNTKAENIIIFDNKINRQKFDYFTFNNIKGRSGRMFQHFVGHVYLFHEPPQEELPFIDIPGFTQSENAPDSLLIQMEEDDLSSLSWDRLEKYRDQDFLSLDTLKANVGIDPEAQLKLAQSILQNLPLAHQNLSWRGMPEYEQLEAVCQIMWDFFNGRGLGGRSITSSRQLALKINSLQKKPRISELIASDLEYYKDPDVAVPKVLDFLRLWASFHFPRLLHAISRIQHEIFTRHEMNTGNYDFYASRVENFFLDPAIVALDEYGIPIQAGRKLESILSPDGDLDTALSNLSTLESASLPLSAFELELLLDAQRSLPGYIKGG